jgi:putative endonuclease
MSRVEGKPYFLYVLWSDAGSRFYLGISEDPQRRLQQHNSGGSVWTSRYSDWRLVHVEQYLSYSQARKRELVLMRLECLPGFKQRLQAGKNTWPSIGAGSVSGVILGPLVMRYCYFGGFALGHQFDRCA